MTAGPAGLIYEEGFLTQAEEAALLAAFAELPWEEVRMHGVVAKRRTKHYGWLYGYDSWQIAPGPPAPGFLEPLRERAAAWARVRPALFQEILVSEYRPGAGIGWHRDAPAFGEPIVGVSLGAACRMRFRRGPARERQTWELELAPRSIYALAGEARRVWQHHIPPTKAPRYSVTFRPLRAASASRARVNADRRANSTARSSA